MFDTGLVKMTSLDCQHAAGEKPLYALVSLWRKKSRRRRTPLSAFPPKNSPPDPNTHPELSTMDPHSANVGAPLAHNSNADKILPEPAQKY